MVTKEIHKMDKRTIHNLIIPAEKYAERMESMVLPYLAERKTENYCEREKGKKIFLVDLEILFINYILFKSECCQWVP